MFQTELPDAHTVARCALNKKRNNAASKVYDLDEELNNQQKKFLLL